MSGVCVVGGLAQSAGSLGRKALPRTGRRGMLRRDSGPLAIHHMGGGNEIEQKGYGITQTAGAAPGAASRGLQEGPGRQHHRPGPLASQGKPRGRDGQRPSNRRTATFGRRGLDPGTQARNVLPFPRRPAVERAQRPASLRQDWGRRPSQPGGPKTKGIRSAKPPGAKANTRVLARSSHPR